MIHAIYTKNSAKRSTNLQKICLFITKQSKMAQISTLNELKAYIKKEVSLLFETAADLSSPKASTFLKLIGAFFPDKANHYKSVIFNRGYIAAVTEFGKETHNTAEHVDKIVAKGFNSKSGNPFGIGNTEKKYKESNELIPDLIDLSKYINKVNELKQSGEI